MSRRTSISTTTTNMDMTPKCESCETQHTTTHDFPVGPQPGKTYKIHHRETRELVTLMAGGITLLSADAQPGGGWFWECVETDGWLGFRNTVSGLYLGHNDELPDTSHLLHAIAPHHRAWEHFMVRLAPNGAHYILVRHRGNSEDFQ
ncbi:hypothetical protein BD289DRAFT_438234 [Coniella lustricola]|uniref:Ricin B lectin domain-containing protein n=1 Tax=Coniella lustricola TaxID=2025994 RepID=A0A2T3A3A1_9PEZI|nr:hypothetical protein BD289DRAFT_438234 [Coniella lustricola]